MQRPPYVPIVMLDGWVLERYYGWRVVTAGPRLKLLRKRIGPVERSLLLCWACEPRDIEQAARSGHLLGAFQISTIVDLSASDHPAFLQLAGHRLERATERPWFGAGTFVFDLAEEEGVLFGGMAARERSKCNQARRGGIDVRFTTAPTAGELQQFLELHGKMASSRALEILSPAVLQHMFARGDALLACCHAGSGPPLVMNVIYLCGDQGCFLHGAKAEEIPAGAGQLAQWSTVLELKRRGFRWYDLGLVASADPKDGIYRFKRALGGSFVDLGTEFRFVAPLLAAPYRWAHALRPMARRLRGWLPGGTGSG